MTERAPLDQQPASEESSFHCPASPALPPLDLSSPDEEDDGLDSPTLEMIGVESDTAADPTPWRFGVAAAACAEGCADAESLLHYLQRERDAASEAPGRRALIDHERGERLALLAWEPAGDGEGAAQAERCNRAAEQAWRGALDADPSLRPPFWALWRTLTAARRWPELLALTDERLRHESDGQRRAELLFHKGWLLAEQLEQPVAAADALRNAWRASDERWIAPPLALEQLGHRHDEPAWVEEACQAIATAATDREARAAALRRLAARRRHAGAAGAREALDLLERASALTQQRLPLLYEREAIAAQAELPAERVRALRALAAALEAEREGARGEHAPGTTSPEAICCLVQAAQLCELALQDHAQAAALLREAEARAPGDEVVAEACLGYARRHQDWTTVVRLLERRLAQSGSAALPAEVASASLLELGLAQARLGAASAASATLQRARQADPHDLSLLIAAEIEAVSAGRWVEVIELALAEERAAATARPSDVAARAAILSRAALVAYVHAARPEQALDLCHAALDLDPAAQVAQELLAELLLVRQRYVPLIELWEHQLCGASPTRVAAGLERIADLAAGPLADPQRALRALDGLAELRPNDLGLTQRRVALCERCGAWEQADALLATLVSSAATPAEREAHLLHRAWLAEHPLADTPRAIARYGEVLDVDPTHWHALLALGALLRRQGAHAALAARWERAAATADDAGQRAAAYEALAALYGGPLAQPERAAAQLARLVHEQPRDRHALRALQRAQLGGARREACAEALAQELPLIGDRRAGALRATLAGEACQLAGAPDAAEHHFVQAATLAQADSATWFAATHALVGLRQARGAFAEAAQALEALADAAPNAAERALWLAEARWWHDVPLAASLAGATAPAPPLPPAAGVESGAEDDPVLLWRSLVAAAQRRDPALLGRALSGLAARCDDPALARVLDRRGGRLQRAASSLSDARPTPPWRDASVGERAACVGEKAHAAALLEQLGDAGAPAAEHAVALEQLAALLHERYRPQLRLALSLAHERADQPAAALQAAAALLREQPDHLPALLTVQRLLAAAGQHEPEARLWLRIARVLGGGAARCQALRRAAAAFERADCAAAAIATYRRLLDAEPGEASLIERLAALATRTGDMAQLHDALTLRLGLALAPAQRIAPLLERARLRVEHLDDRRGAARDLLRVLAIDPEHAEAWQRLAGISDAAGDEARAVSCYNRVLELDGVVEQRVAVALRLIELLTRAGRRAEATALCREQLQLAPGKVELLDRLAELLLAAGEARGAGEVLTQLVAGSAAEPRRQAAALCRLGALRAEVLGEPERAREDFARALALDPLNTALLAQVHDRLAQGSSRPLGTAWATPLVERLRELIEHQPLQPEPYRALGELAARLDQPLLERAAVAALDALGAATAAEQQGLAKGSGRAAAPLRGHLAPADWPRLQPASASGPYRELWRLCVPALPALFPEHLPRDGAQLGCGRLLALEAAGALPLAAFAREAAAALGLPRTALLVGKEAGDRVIALHGEPPLLVLGVETLATDTPQQRFRLGRWLALLCEQATACALLTADELRLAVAATVYCVEPGTGFGLPRDRVAAAARTLRRRLGRRALRALPLVVQRLIQHGGTFEQWRQAILIGADRCGLLLAGELGPALEQLAAEARLGTKALPSGPGADAAGRVSDTPEAPAEAARRAGLVAFSVSAELLELRGKLLGSDLLS